MSKELTHSQRVARDLVTLIRDTLKDLPMACTEFIRAIEPTTAPLTRLGYARDLRLFFSFLSAEISEFGGFSRENWTYDQLDRISSTHIEIYMDYLSLYINENETKYSNKELGKMRKLSTLRSFFKYLFKTHRVSANVSVLVDMPKRHEKPILRLEIDEMARLLDLVESGDALTERQKTWHEYTKNRDLCMLTLFLGTGIRVSECVGIDIDDIDFENNSFLVTRKGGNQVILYFPDEVADIMRSYMAWRREQQTLPGHENALFLSMQKRRITTRAVENMVKKYALQAAPLKKRMSPHKLRSTFGTNLYQETGDIYLVADVLGHSDVNTTRRHYADMSDERRRMAAKSVTLRSDPAPKDDPE
ncbi:tyrosine-type recombinase/integrase [Eubacteriales bacterium OttesenSCG-928-N13]|nr:tyrosine-type recombinase/integrase [Eubacteriales bacterium OttesenSCG-928-N13]